MSKTYLFIGGPAHGKEIETEGPSYVVAVPDFGAPDYRCDHPDHPPVLIPSKQVLYRSRKLFKTYHIDKLRRFGSYAMSRDVMVQADLTDDEAMEDLREYLLDTFLSTGERREVPF